MSIKIKHAASAGLILYLASLTMMLTMRTESLPQIEFDWFGIAADKVVHGLIFLPFPILTWLATCDADTSKSRRITTGIAILLSGVAIAACTEIIQNFTEYREGDIKDFAADCIGLAIGMFIVMIIHGFAQKRRK